ncbi:MAG TPA: hypothetical protein VGN05_12000, partial [Parvibaculum sp.]
MSTAVSRPDLPDILRAYLKEQLEADRAAHLTAKPGHPVYARSGTFDPLNVTAQDADLDLLTFLQSGYADAIVERDISGVEHIARGIMAERGLEG